MSREAHLGDLLAGDQRLRLGAELIAGGLEASNQLGAVIEIATLESDSDTRDEPQWGLATRHALPEPVAHRQRAEATAQRAQARVVETQVPRLVARNAQQTPPKSRGASWNASSAQAISSSACSS